MKVIYPNELPQEVDIDGLQLYDWAEVFGEGVGGNCDGNVTSHDGTKCDPVCRSMVKVVIATLNGENSENDWVGLFLLYDGRFLAATGGCDYSGWGCQASNTLQVGETLDEVVLNGLDNTARRRFGITIEYARDE